MRYILGSVVLWMASSQAFGITQENLISHFAPGAVKASLGAIVLTGSSRQCNSLSGCTDWAPSNVKLNYTIGEIWEYDYNQSSRVGGEDGVGAVPMPTDARAELALDHQNINLNISLGTDQMGDPQSPYITTSIQYDSALQAFSTTGGHFFGKGFFAKAPSENRVCERTGMHNACLVGHNCDMGRFAVGDVDFMNTLKSIDFNAHSVSALYEQSGPLHSDGSHTEARILFYGTF